MCSGSKTGGFNRVRDPQETPLYIHVRKGARGIISRADAQTCLRRGRAFSRVTSMAKAGDAPMQRGWKSPSWRREKKGARSRFSWKNATFSGEERKSVDEHRFQKSGEARQGVSDLEGDKGGGGGREGAGKEYLTSQPVCLWLGEYKAVGRGKAERASLCWRAAEERWRE